MTEIPGLKKDIYLFNISHYSLEWLYSQYSSYRRFIKVLGYLLRCKSLETLIANKTRKVTIKEYEATERRVIFILQREAFPREFQCLTPIPKLEVKKSPKRLWSPNRKPTRLDMFVPFVDEHGLLHVGGRLNKANLLWPKASFIVAP